jgi:hypothetical protein
MDSLEAHVCLSDAVTFLIALLYWWYFAEHHQPWPSSTNWDERLLADGLTMRMKERSDGQYDKSLTDGPDPAVLWIVV